MLILLLRIAGAFVLTMGLWQVVRASTRDRARGRRRCPQCWYSMDGVPGRICPECGKAAASERGLLRTRRSRPGILLGIAMMLIGAGVALFPEVRRANVGPWLPRPLLVAATVALDDQGGPLFNELAGRAMGTGGPTCAGWSSWEVRWTMQHAGRVLVRTGAGPGNWVTLRRYQPPSLAETLLATSGPLAAPAVPPLLTGLDSPSAPVCVEMLSTIGGGNQQVVDALSQALLTANGAAPSAVAQALAAVSVSESQQEQLERTLSRAMLLPDPPRQIAALFTLSRRSRFISDKAVLARSIESLRATVGPQVVEQACVVLAMLEDEGARSMANIVCSKDGTHALLAMKVAAMYRVTHRDVVEATREVAQQSPSDLTRWRAVSTLSCIASRDEALHALLTAAAAKDPAADVRMAALWALRQTAPADVTLEAARQCLNDGDPRVRGAAVGVLVFLARESHEAYQLLEETRAHPDREVAALAERACLEQSSKAAQAHEPPMSDPDAAAAPPMDHPRQEQQDEPR